MKTRYDKSKIMKTAWSIKRRNQSVSFGECLTIAWQRAKCDVYEARKAEELANRPLDMSIYSFKADYNYTGGIESYYKNGAYSGD